MTKLSNRQAKLLFAVAMAVMFSGADWLQFRGSDGSGVSGEKSLPLGFEPDKNVAWKSPLPGRGPAGPIVIGDKVIITASSGTKQNRLHVLCMDARSGKQLWHRQFWATGRTLCHPMSAIAAPTPASDGKLIYAFFSSNDLICLDLDGNLKWYRGLAHDYPHAGNDVGMSSSPAVVGQTVIVQIENQGDSFAAGIDTSTGETRWRKKRDRRANWASPLGVRGEKPGEDYVLLQSPSGLTANNAYTGAELWRYKKNCSGIPSPVVVGSDVYLASDGITLLRKAAKSRSPKVVWKSSQLRPIGPSAVVYKGRVYSVNRTILVCGDGASGKVLWKTRLAGGRYWSTPVIAGDHLYVINADGKMDVVKLTGEKPGQIVNTSTFGETILGTPAVAGGAMFVRSDKHLWKVSSQ